MSLFNRVAFYPTLFYNVMMTKVTNRKWYDRIDETVLLGALPFRGMTKWFVTEENVRGVVTLNEEWELTDFCNTSEEWQKHGVTQLKIPTIDFTASPSQTDLHKAVEFITQYRTNDLGSVYVHCKAGRTRSATVVACYLVKIHNWTPEKAVEFIQEKRPHIWLREKQLDSIQQFYKTCNNDVSSGA
ncbi:Phosphatidylglycerophosphatase and protein-tyrosine phosphatase 1 [Mactra antiquata]